MASLSTFSKKRTLLVAVFSSITINLFALQSGFAAPVHAYFADEHNDNNSATGNRILEIDIESMSLVNSLDVPGVLGHHADNAFNSKIYGVPKESGFINIIDLKKDQNGTTSMTHSGQVDLIHKPRSGDAYNKKFNVVLMAASNRPMASFINVETDEVVGMIGENVDCTLTTGEQLLSHSDANTIAGATKYHCVNADHGGNQISGHPYWLTPDYAAIVDRSNRQISVYNVWQEGSQLKSRLVNHLPTRTSIHQIVPRDRTSLPSSQQADFYAVEEGNNGNGTSYGIPHALIKMKLTTNGLIMIGRIDLQRTQVTNRATSDHILQSCINIYRSTGRPTTINTDSNIRLRTQRYQALFQRQGISANDNQQSNTTFPAECFHPGIPGGHNGDFAPNNRDIYIGMAGGAMAIIDVDRWIIKNYVDVGVGTGPGHTCFSERHDMAIITTHGTDYVRVIDGVSTARPDMRFYMRYPLGFTKEGLTNTYQSHTCYVDEGEDFYYNFFTDGGVFYKMDLDTMVVVDSIYTGGIPIQGSYIDLDNINSNTPAPELTGNQDTASSSGEQISIDVLANDAGNGLTVTLVDSPANGTVSINNNAIDYTPKDGYIGTDEFWYQLTDSRGWYTWGQVLVTVTSTQPPTVLKAFGDAADSDGSAITLDVVANDIGNGLTISLVNTPNNGVATIVNNKIKYQPERGFTGVDEFWYQVTDSRGWYTWAQILVTVSNVAPPPQVILKGITDTATSNGSAVVVDVIANDIGSGLTITLVNPASNGSATIINNKITYLPDTGFTGTEEFWYQITDSRGWFTWGQVLVEVN